MTSTLICYHAADYDGILSGYLAQGQFLTHVPRMLGVNYGDVPPLSLLREESYRHLVIVDFSWPMDIMHELSAAVSHMIWIDHHKTALEAYQAAAPFPDKDIVVLDLSKAACELVWDHFWPYSSISRGIQAIGAWDIKDWSNVPEDQSENFQYAVRLAMPTCEDSRTWSDLLNPAEWSQHQETGRLIRRWERKNNEYRAKYFSTVMWEGLTWRMQVGSATPVEVMWSVDPGPYAGIIGVNFTNGKWTVSLRRVPGSELDLSALAKRHGGGGHPGAAGFTCPGFPAELFGGVV